MRILALAIAVAALVPLMSMPHASAQPVAGAVPRLIGAGPAALGATQSVEPVFDPGLSDLFEPVAFDSVEVHHDEGMVLVGYGEPLAVLVAEIP